MDFERKKDFEILEEITSYLSGIKIGKDFSLRKIEEHKFKDGFIIESKLNRRIIVLENNGERIGLLGFTVKNRTLEIEGIQGIGKTKEKQPSNWHTFLLTPFITACLKVYETKENITKYISYPDVYRQEEKLKRTINNLEKEKKKLAEEKLSAYERMITLKNIDSFYDSITDYEKTIKTIKKIRDDYFTKDGKINLNKLKIIDVFKKREKQKKILSRYKKVKEIRKMKRR